MKKVQKSILQKSWMWIPLAILYFLSGCNQNHPIILFNGKTLDGWEVKGNPEVWKVSGDILSAGGSGATLFYTGNTMNVDFKNFEFSTDIKTTEGATAGIFFHTALSDDIDPVKGFQCMVANPFSHKKSYPGNQEKRATGSLRDVRNLTRSVVSDDEWFNYRITVQGKTIRTYINDQLLVDYTESESPWQTEDGSNMISSGTFALQSYTPTGSVSFKNMSVKPLPDNMETPGKALEDNEYESLLRDYYARTQLPLTDFHGHFKKGLTPAQLLEHSRKYGINYGVAFNCGIKMGFEEEDSLHHFLDNYERPPGTFLAMQAEGREWVDMFSEDAINRFDYVITDAMTWTNDKGQRMRLWMPEETHVGDPLDFMDQLVDRTVKILLEEPVDIFVNATYLPEDINDAYDELWTEERMDKVIDALVKSGVAMELNARREIPSARFIEKAKAAGVKFTFGTNNAGPDDLGHLDYCLELTQQCNLEKSDFWFPDI
ncbi:MAG: family 16 glycoside hydrolase [Bacteroidales bacterium]